MLELEFFKIQEWTLQSVISRVARSICDCRSLSNIAVPRELCGSGEDES